MPVRSPLTGAKVAQALMMGPLTDLRIQKAARHLAMTGQFEQFLNALPAEKATEVAEKLKPMMPSFEQRFRR